MGIRPKLVDAYYLLKGNDGQDESEDISYLLLRFLAIHLTWGVHSRINIVHYQSGHLSGRFQSRDNFAGSFAQCLHTWHHLKECRRLPLPYIFHEATAYSSSHSINFGSTVKMSSPSLSGLMNELVLEIFELLPDHHAVAALNSTSRKFYLIWRSNAAAISDAVLPRVIACYDSAEELFRFQRAQEREPETEEPETNEQKPDEATARYRGILKRNNRLIANQCMISKECVDLFTEDIGESFRNYPRALQEGPGFKYLRIRYRIHCIAALSFDRLAQDEYLEATPLEDLTDMRLEYIWINPRHYYTDFEYFRIYTKTQSARDPFALIERAFREKVPDGRHFFGMSL